MNQLNLQQTREIIRHALNSNFIKGDVCDFGAGTAKYKAMVLPKCRSYIAMDFFKNESIDVVGDVENSGFDNNKFDTVICTQVLEHTKHPWLVVKEICRILKNNGVAVITAPFLVPYHPDPEDNFRFTPSGMKTIFEDAGFEILESDFYGNHYLVFSEMLHFHFDSPYKKHGKIKDRFFIYLSKFLRFLDKKSKAQSIFADTYVIAKKI